MRTADASELLAAKVELLRRIIAGYSRVAVAVSGGVDSSLLLHVACTVLGRNNVLGLFANSPLLPAGELENVLAVAGRLGCRLETVELDPLSRPEFVANPPDRCYLCKKLIYSRLLTVMAGQDISCLLDGTNRSDFDDFRPGRRAIAELGVKIPLAEAAISKVEVRQISRDLGLATWDRPSASCLATRIPAGVAITRELLELVDQCERFLYGLGFLGCRVRCSGKEARIELAAGHLMRFMEGGCHRQVTDFFWGLGISRVLLDLAERKAG